MQFEQNQLISKREFYTQNGNFGVAVDFNVNDPSGRYEFGLSGSNLLTVVLESGLIKYNNLTLQSYLPNNDYSLLLEVTNNNLNIAKDNYELAYGLNKTTGDFNLFYFKRDNPNINAQFDFSLSGSNLPIYSVKRSGFLLSTGANSVTGRFSNLSGYGIKFFNSISNGLQGLNYGYVGNNIKSGEKLSFFYSGDFSNFDFSQPITTSFYTNFGNLLINFKITDATSLNNFILLNEINDYNFNEDNQINRELFYSNYSGGVISDSFSTDVSFLLRYLDGSGRFTVDDFASSATFAEFAYGNFRESGIVTGVASIQTGDSLLTGVYSVPFSRFKWATGPVTGYFTGLGIGIASGQNYTGLAAGQISGSLMATVLDGSGSFVWNSVLATGVLINSGAAIGFTGYSNATGFINLYNVPMNSAFFIGVESDPIVRGLHYNDATGLVAYLSGNLNHRVKGFASGQEVRLEALASGDLGNGIFIRNFSCNPSLVSFSSFLTGGANIGDSGFAVYSNNTPFSGFVSSSAIGSGDYSLFVTGNQEGSFTFTRTFTGVWSLLTGLNQNSLFSVPRINNELFSGQARDLSPNSSVIFQINHDENPFNVESVLFSVSGDNILNPISTIISQ